jgi:ligand-binding sensor protein
MLNDGRLTGIKVGKHWRVPRSSIEAILEGGVPDLQDGKPSITPQVLPIHYVQFIQDVFAEVAGFGSVTTTKEGEPLTSISNSCQFCDLILASKTGYQGCLNSWKKLASLPPAEEISFFTCHAGLKYAYSRIYIDGEFTATLIAGQYHVDDPDPQWVSIHTRELAQQHGINPDALAEAVKNVPVIHERIQSKIGKWLQKVVTTFGEIGSERAELIRRLNHIADMTKLEKRLDPNFNRKK